MTKVIKKWANDEQRWLFERGPSPTLLVGGVGSGKTVGCVLKSLALLDRYPGSRIGVIRRSYTQLLKTTAETWYQWCSPKLYDKGKRNEQVLDLNNGSRAYFIHLDQPNSLDLLAGLELNFAYVSQADELQEKAWDLLDVRIGRWSGAKIPKEMFDAAGGKSNWLWKNQAGECVPPRYFFAEGYVTDESHFLFKRFAEESPERDKWAAQGYGCRIVNTESNIYAIGATVQAALSKDDDYVRRYVRPEWGNPEGKIFKVDQSSVLDPDLSLLERVTRTMKLHRSLDHGESAPTCCLWLATDYDGNIFVYREYYQPDGLISQHRQVITQLSREDFAGDVPKYHSDVADPSIFSKDRGKSVNSKPQWSVADDYCDTRVMPRDTVIRWQPANNDELATRSRLKEYLRVDPNHRNPVTGKMGAPRLYFIKKTTSNPNGCAKVIAELRGQTRKKAKSGDREVWLDERDDTVPDHAYDACLAPGTKVLKGDLNWVSIGDIRVGDVLLGFDEQGEDRTGLGPGGCSRRWQPSVVEAVKTVNKPSYRLTFSDNTEVTCSTDHLWLSRSPAGSHPAWISAEDLDGENHWEPARARGKLSGEREVLKPLEVWAEDVTHGAGYLSAAFDGEGCLSQSINGGHVNINFSQKQNVFLDKVREVLTAKGFKFNEYVQSDPVCTMHGLDISGGFIGKLSFLGSVRPLRLLSKLDLNLGRFQSKDALRVIERKFLGGTEVVALQTSSRTLIAEGFASHNCKYFVCGRPSLGPMQPKKPLAPGEIPLAVFEQAEKASRVRKRLEQRRAGVARFGYGEGT